MTDWQQVRLGSRERLDDLMYKGRRLIQNTEEFCFSLDAVLLAHFPRYHRSDRVLELGTGAGVIPHLMVDKVNHVEALELNPVLAELAERNVRLNGLEERISIHEGDYRRMEEFFPAEAFDLVLANPPYRPVAQGKHSLSSGKAMARHELTATLQDVVQAARYGLRFGGHFAMVHLPERLGEIICALHEKQMEVKRLQLIQPKPGKAPNLMLLEAVVGAAPGIKFLPNLLVREADGSYSAAVKQIYGE